MKTTAPTAEQLAADEQALAAKFFEREFYTRADQAADEAAFTTIEDARLDADQTAAINTRTSLLDQTRALREDDAPKRRAAFEKADAKVNEINATLRQALADRTAAVNDYEEVEAQATSLERRAERITREIDKAKPRTFLDALTSYALQGVVRVSDQREGRWGIDQHKGLFGGDGGRMLQRIIARFGADGQRAVDRGLAKISGDGEVEQTIRG